MNMAKGLLRLLVFLKQKSIFTRVSREPVALPKKILARCWDVRLGILGRVGVQTSVGQKLMFMDVN